jgi:hypothetical protein
MSDVRGVGEPSGRNEAAQSAVSWAAIFAGAVAIAALSLALVALGTGVGFSVAPPWTSPGMPVARIGRTTVIWIVLMQIIASAVGGYLAGRLRTRWVNLHTHEVFFRDTAHGFLAWAVSLVLTAGLLTSAASAMTGTMMPAPGVTAASIAAERDYAAIEAAQPGRTDAAAAIQAQMEERRKAIAHSLYWTFVALLIGAFCASAAATVGGRERDHLAAL